MSVVKYYTTASGWEVFHYECCESTNKEAKKLISKIDSGELGEESKEIKKVIIGEQQSAGYGTNVHKWASPPGNVYMSVILSNLKPTEAILGNDAPLNKLFGRLAITTSMLILESIRNALNARLCDVLEGEQFGEERLFKQADVKIKWPNDLFLDGRKIAGVLVEAEGDFVIIGLGINVLTAPVLEGERKTSCLFDYAQSQRSDELTSFLCMSVRELIVYDLLEGFDKIHTLIFEHFQKIKQTWESVSFEINKEVERASLTGIFRWLGEDGEMVLETADKQLHAIWK
ncbi:MAG: biotin--[acetyl-CoA-carboxylase] ligase [Holosporales bacterium]|jgi:BirA family biotin operon repressor/biotin-[acetyl-CoA-carboxylase] ligase|nr:biotin--[acetyl-CoA-carboxylase] ligase [Holosporales bacterium]